MSFSKTKTSWAIGAITLFAAEAALSATIYVSPSGSNSNAGTINSPLQSISAAVSAARAGDTIILKDGVYTAAVNINKAGTSSAYITLKAENKHKAILDCQKSCHSAINLGSSSAYWVIEGLDIRNTNNGGIWSNAGGGKNIVVRGNRIRNIGNRTENSNIGICGIYTDEAASFVIDGNIIHDVGRTNRVSNGFDHGIYSHGDLKIMNNIFYNSLSGWHIQTAESFRGTIANNTFVGPNMFGGKPGQIVLWGRNSNVRIVNNIFYGAYRSPVSYADNSQQTNCRVENNIAYTPGSTLSLSGNLPSGCAQSNNRLNVDPLLVSPSLSSLDLRLRSGSPAIGTAVSMASMFTHDFTGATRTAWDLGAYAFGSSSPQPQPTPAPTPVPTATPPPSSSYTASIVVTGDPASGSYSIEGVTNVPGDVRVEFYDNGVLKTKESYAPYCMLAELSSGCGAGSLGAGVHNLEIRVYAETGTTVLARATRTITDGPAADTQAPSVQLVTPSSTSVARGSQVSISASASDNVGVARVEFYVNDVMVASDASSPYSASFRISPIAGKSYRVEAIAYDQAGNSRVSPAVTLTSQ